MQLILHPPPPPPPAQRTPPFVDLRLLLQLCTGMAAYLSENGCANVSRCLTACAPSASVAALGHFLPRRSKPFQPSPPDRGHLKQFICSSFCFGMSVSTTRHVIILGESNCGKVPCAHHFGIVVVPKSACLTRLQSELMRKLCGAPFLGESSPTLGIASQVS